MAGYLIRRTLLMIPTLLGVLVMVFFIMKASPGSVEEMLLDSEGKVQEGDRTARMVYLQRRYGLDKPAIVQFGRWLNKVSPLGFKTSDQITFDQVQLDALATQLRAYDFLVTDDHRRIASEAVQDLARRDGTTSKDAAMKLFDGIQDAPLATLFSLSGFGDVPSDLSAPPADARLRLKRAYEVGADARKSEAEGKPDEARRAVLRYLYEDLAGQNRIVFSRPVFKQPDLGQSFLKNRPVSDLIAEALPITITLNVVSIPLIYSLAILIGVYAGRHQGKLFDIGSGVVMLALWSIPTIWAGVLLIGFLANNEYVRWFPTGNMHDVAANDMPFLPRFGDAGFERGWLLDTAWHLCLPVICMTYGGLAFLTKLTRGSVLENLRADFVRTARAKGVGARDVLWHHVFRNSLLPLITVTVNILPAMLAGSLIVEKIFSLPGMGRLYIESIEFKDQETVMAITLISGLLTLVANLAADVLYAAVDPRVSYE